MDVVAVKTTDVLLTMTADRPFFKGFLVAGLAHLGGHRDRHFGLARVPGGHRPVTGFAGDAREGEMAGSLLQARHMAGEARGFGSRLFPDFLKVRRERPGMDGPAPIRVFLSVAGGAGFGSGEF